MEDANDEVAPGGGPLGEILRDPVGVWRRRWLAIAIVAAAGVLATAVAVMLVKPEYSARATVLIASQKLAEAFVRPTIEEDLLERVNALTAEALSRENLIKVIEKYDLYPDLREESGITEAVSAVRKRIEVEFDSGALGPIKGARAQIIGIRYTASTPELAADIANEVAGMFTAAGIRIRTQQTRITTEFMRRELLGAEEALREQTRKISEFQQAHRGELPSELESNLRRLERLQQQRNSLALQIADAETRLAIAAAEPGAGNPRAARLDQLREQLARELAVSTEAHPNVSSLRRQIELMEAQVSGAPGPASGLAASRGIVQGAGRREVIELREQLAETDRELAELDVRVAKIPAREEELSALLQRATVLRENYLDFLRKVKEAELSESLELAQQGDRVSVLDAAYPPSEPERTRLLVAAGGLVASLGLGLLAGLLLELRDPVLVSAAALEAATGLRVLGSIPRIG